MIHHAVAFLTGFLLDCILGDPYRLPHPVRLIGHFINWLEKKLLHEEDEPEEKQNAGLYMVVIVCLLTIIITGTILLLSYTFNPYFGLIVESILSYYCLAAKSLKNESMKVYRALNNQGIEEGRKAVSMIVGRDTESLSKEGVIKAAVETVAENTSDGVIAPMLFLALGGPLLGLLYKAINTMDSMVGYKNDKYIDFGRAAAKLDDVANYLPARISALLMTLACVFLPAKYNAKEALRIFKRDRYKHSSPNSAQTEAACAGALGIRLAGPASYFGKKVYKDNIGDEKRQIEVDDIKRANVLMYATSILGVLLSLIIFWAVIFVYHL